MRSLMRYARQLGQRRNTAFYLSPEGETDTGGQVQHFFDGYAKMADRPRSLREMFSESEYEGDDDPVDDPRPDMD